MAEKSAGVLAYRLAHGIPEIFLVHPGGPFWVKKDDGAWSVPKGLIDEDEDHLAAARREFLEETGQAIDGHFIELVPLKQKSGKTIYCWAVEHSFDPAQCKSNLFEMEWPRNSGRKQSFEEVDKFSFFAPALALKKVHMGQAGFIRQLLDHLHFPVPVDIEIENAAEPQAQPAQASLF